VVIDPARDRGAHWRPHDRRAVGGRQCGSRRSASGGRRSAPPEWSPRPPGSPWTDPTARPGRLAARRARRARRGTVTGAADPRAGRRRIRARRGEAAPPGPSRRPDRALGPVERRAQGLRRLAADGTWTGRRLHRHRRAWLAAPMGPSWPPRLAHDVRGLPGAGVSSGGRADGTDGWTVLLDADGAAPLPRTELPRPLVSGSLPFVMANVARCSPPSGPHPAGEIRAAVARPMAVGRSPGAPVSSPRCQHLRCGDAWPSGPPEGTRRLYQVDRRSRSCGPI
jgi:hypothetical protein